MGEQTAVNVFDRTIDEIEARAIVISRWKWVVGLLLLIPPLTLLGLVFLLYQFHEAGERVDRDRPAGPQVARRDGSLVVEIPPLATGTAVCHSAGPPSSLPPGHRQWRRFGKSEPL